MTSKERLQRLHDAREEMFAIMRERVAAIVERRPTEALADAERAAIKRYDAILHGEHH